MFKDEWSKNEPIKLEDVEYDTMVRLVKAIHTGVVENDVRPDDLLKLFKIAHQYQVEHVVKQCEELVTKKTTINSLMALDFLIDGQLRSSNAFVNSGIRGLVRNPECLYSVPKPDRYKDMTPTIIETVMRAMAHRIGRMSNSVCESCQLGRRKCDEHPSTGRTCLQSLLGL